jgi:hypothetical protein
VEGPLNNLQASMIQFSKPKRTLSKAMEQFRRHETSAKEYLSSPVDDGELIASYPSRSLLSYLFIQFADRVLLAGLTRAFIGLTMLSGTSHKMLNLCAPKPPTPPGCPCLPQTVHSEQEYPAGLLPSAALTGVMPAPSYPRKDQPGRTVRVSSGVQSVRPTAVRPIWHSPNPTDCGGALRSPPSLAPPTSEAYRNTITRVRMTSPI